MVVSFCDFVFDNSFNKDNVSKRKRELFIAQLLQFAELPKHKQRMYACLQVSKNLDSDTVE